MSRLVMLFALSSALALLLLAGCASTGANGNESSAGVPAGSDTNKPSTYTGENGAAVTSLPAAQAGYWYSTEISFTNGKDPFSCKLASGSLPNGIAFDEGSCWLSGDAPELQPGGTKDVYPFSFTATDANGVKSGPFSLALTVVPLPPTFNMYGIIMPAQVGVPYDHDFCYPPSNTPLNCGKDPPSSDPSSGVPPYTFTASRLPLGLMIRSDGHLSGTVPKGASMGDQEFEVCAVDFTGTEACNNATLTIKPPAEKWRGTISGKWVNPYDTNFVEAGSSWSYEYTVEFDFPTSLSSMMRASTIDQEKGSGTLSGKQAILTQSKFATQARMRYTGGTVASTPIEVEAYGGGASQSIELTGPKDSNFAPGYREDFYQSGARESITPFFANEINLKVASITDTSISGTWMLGEQYDTRPRGSVGASAEGTSFTLNRVE
ncbi:MAG: Ig domain-containing protein [Candidatus Micrarchaeota archaeon]|nr:Ig domain-containing protein [Candidatus Micrarchaeota archaeon]